MSCSWSKADLDPALSGVFGADPTQVGFRSWLTLGDVSCNGSSPVPSPLLLVWMGDGGFPKPGLYRLRDDPIPRNSNKAEYVSCDLAASGFITRTSSGTITFDSIDDLGTAKGEVSFDFAELGGLFQKKFVATGCNSLNTPKRPSTAPWVVMCGDREVSP
jgi:hypothetical protein